MTNFILWRKDRLLNLVQIQTTSICNGRCICCPYKESWYMKNPGYMSDELYEKILNDIVEYDPKFSGKFCPYLCNEPFADKKIVERTEMAYNILDNPFMELSTNCELMTPDKTDAIYDIYKKHNFYGNFGLSHHGIDKKSFEHNMGIDYDKSIKNMIYFLQKFDGKMRIGIQDMAYSLDQKFRMNPYRAVDRYLNKLIDDNGINRHNLILSPKVFHNRAGNVHTDGWDYQKIIRKIDDRNPFDCLRATRCLHVIYTGEIIGCCMDYYNETISGDLTQMTVKEYFDSGNYEEWKDMVRGKLESSENFICKRCMSPGG